MWDCPIIEAGEAYRTRSLLELSARMNGQFCNFEVYPHVAAALSIVGGQGRRRLTLPAVPVRTQSTFTYTIAWALKCPDRPRPVVAKVAQSISSAAFRIGYAHKKWSWLLPEIRNTISNLSQAIRFPADNNFPENVEPAGNARRWPYIHPPRCCSGSKISRAWARVQMVRRASRRFRESRRRAGDQQQVRTGEHHRRPFLVLF